MFSHVNSNPFMGEETLNTKLANLNPFLTEGNTKPITNPFRSPAVKPFNNSVTNVFGTPSGSPFSNPSNNPFGNPFNNPFGNPFGNPFMANGNGNMFNNPPAAESNIAMYATETEDTQPAAVVSTDKDTSEAASYASMSIADAWRRWKEAHPDYKPLITPIEKPDPSISKYFLAPETFTMENLTLGYPGLAASCWAPWAQQQ
ncbi:hypothetical protein B0T21DRAFT_414352 [Apiosordaria backusii]|uniref:Uncharacterized protein n=1 Tax=Apiosordaria backusii TaxID=314023 RepID=A0AA40AXX7_9PEZI|nr:hypothetical protein B0T21DRAFT_414352 [Apiosordaria backusii]